MRFQGLKSAPLRRALSVGVMALWVGLCAPVAPAWAQDKDKAPVEEVVRPEAGVIFQAAQELFKAGQFPQALAKVKEIEALPELTPYERFSYNRTRGFIAQRAGDNAQARQALEAVVNDVRLKPTERQSVLTSLTAVSQRLNDSVATARYAREFFKSGGTGDPMRLALARALFNTKDFAGAAQELKPVVDGAEAAGKKPDEDVLKLWAGSYLQQNDDNGYYTVLRKLVRHYPAPDYWGDLISRLQRRPGFNDRLLLDTYRLMRHTESLEDQAEYVAMAQLAILAAQPGEALSVLEEGFSKDLLGKGPAAAGHKDLMGKVKKAAADDRATLEASEASARKANDGQRLFSVGAAAFSYGLTDKGLALMEQGLALGVKRQAEDAKLQQAVALIKAGRRAQAEPILKAIQGADGLSDLAEFWLLASR